MTICFLWRDLQAAQEDRARHRPGEGARPQDPRGRRAREAREEAGQEGTPHVSMPMIRSEMKVHMPALCIRTLCVPLPVCLWSRCVAEDPGRRGHVPRVPGGGRGHGVRLDRPDAPQAVLPTGTQHAQLQQGQVGAHISMSVFGGD